MLRTARPAPLPRRRCHPRVGRVPAGYFGPDLRDQLPAVVGGVLKWVVPANEQRGHAEVHIIEQRLGDRVRRPDQGGGVAAGPAGPGRGRPQRPVVQVALGRGRQQPLRAGVLRLPVRAAPAPVLGRRRPGVLDGLQDAVRPFPGEVLGGAQDRPERHADPGRGAARGGGRGPDRGDLLGGLLERLAPQRERVRVLAADPVGGGGGAAEEQRDAGRPYRPHPGVVALEAVEPAVEAERLRLSPRPPEDLQVLVGPRVPLVLAQVVTVAALLRVVAAGDHVHGHPAAGELVQGGELPRRQGGEHEPGPVRDEQAEPLGVRRDVRGHLGTFRPGRAVADEDAVEARVLVRLGVAAGEVRVQQRAWSAAATPIRRWCGSSR